MGTFGSAAALYDQEFTNTPIGGFQRQAVWSYLERALPKQPIRILELNGGTGEDAVWLAQKGNTVTCTDASDEMLVQAKQKAGQANRTANISFSRLNFNEVDSFIPTQKFDLIFSNFGGLNCVDQIGMKRLIQSTTKWLEPQGELIWVIMGKFCLWEWLYFTVKGKPARAQQRKTNEAVAVNVNGESISTWYYSPAEIAQLSADNFRVKCRKAVGVFVPPSYLNPFFDRRRSLLDFLNKLDVLFGSSAIFSGLSDHYLIHLKRR